MTLDLRTRPLFLALKQGQQRNISNLDNLKPNAWNITNSVSRSTESRDQNFIIFFNIVQRTIIGDESGDPLTVFDQLNPDAFSDSRVGLVGFEGCSEMGFFVVEIGPSVGSAGVSEFTGAFD